MKKTIIEKLGVIFAGRAGLFSDPELLRADGKTWSESLNYFQLKEY